LYRNIEFRNNLVSYNTQGTYIIEYNVTFSDNTTSGWKQYSFEVTKAIDKVAVEQAVRNKIKQHLQGLTTSSTIDWDNIVNDIKINVADVNNIEFRNAQYVYDDEGTYTI